MAPSSEMGKNVSKRLLAGVDIGGTKTAVVLSSDPPHVLARRVFPTCPEKGPELAIGYILENFQGSLASLGIANKDVAAIGVACGGPLDPIRGLIQSPPNLTTWNDVAICSILEAEFGVPAFLENDANAGALAEASFGAGQGAKNLVFLTMGTGLGAGLILNGKLHRGSSHSAGEIGHVRLTAAGPSGYGKIGTAEGWASGAGMAQVARMHLERARELGQATLLARGTSAAITAKDVADALNQGDEVASAIVIQVGEKLGETIAILVDVLNPECVIIGGLALRFGEALLAPAREAMKQEALLSSAESCRIVPAGLGEQIGDIAALCVAMQGITNHDRSFA